VWSLYPVQSPQYPFKQSHRGETREPGTRSQALYSAFRVRRTCVVARGPSVGEGTDTEPAQPSVEREAVHFRARDLETVESVSAGGLRLD
jgi:hypothetical protein